MPTRIADGNTIKNPDEQPYYIASDSLPKLLASEEQKKMVEGLGDSSSSLVTVMIIVPMVAGIALKGILGKLWAMIATF